MTDVPHDTTGGVRLIPMLRATVSSFKKKPVHKTATGMACVALLALSGCGAPVFHDMHPTVWKPAVEVLLVDHPQGWSNASVTGWTNSYGVTSRVRDVSGGQVPSVLTNDIRQGGIGLFIVVSGGPISYQSVAFAENHLSHRFELLGSSAYPSKLPSNVREVVGNPSVVGYWSGWLVGALAKARGVTSIGWDIPAQGNPVSLLKAAAAGVWISDPTASVMSGTGAGVTGNLLPPSLVLTGTQVLPSQQGALSSGQTSVISVVGQTQWHGGLCEAIPPNVTSVSQDLLAFKNRRWKSGIDYVASPLPLLVKTSLLPPVVQSSFQMATSTTVISSQTVDTIWNEVGNSNSPLYNLVPPQS